MRRLRLLAASLCLLLAAPAGAQQRTSGSATVDAIRGRGHLLCGVSGEIAGFSLSDSRGEMRGLDADYCRAIAAAVLGDAARVRFVNLSAQNRFTALQSGEIDVLIRNTGWSLTREANLGLMFAATNFWDGTTFIVRADAGVTSPAQLDGATVCVRPGTSTELDLADYFRTHKLRFTPVLIGGVNEVQDAFLAGRCDAFTTDASQLAGFRWRLGPDRAKAYTILPQMISTGPSGSMVRKGDDRWFDVVRWVHFALVTAEALGVRSADLPKLEESSNPDIRRLLGRDGSLGAALGLDGRWAYEAIRQVGNYGEMWERSITPMGIERGPNALWTQGGLQFAPPMR
ncbi:amino acid ABC transporter substrate-binding protein [Roseicella aquatilis]|uniref:Amino acid ABC transporter substrate-binding protein n=1 Tax=Roseicella aquatilis TaxID=2527868 RepID=A0A4R4DW01_9PROT|nr:amino acid ABC transporter substrate-binding protein [Roseicella aquatilis]TCZ64861.1 amino acid ABC transporter substrate-binding protein [Roseicella aquatilis]